MVQEVFVLNFDIVKKSFSLSKLIVLNESLLNQVHPIPLAVELTYNELIETQQNIR